MWKNFRVKMWKKSVIFVWLYCLTIKSSECKKTFLVIGPQTIPYRQKYSLAVSSSGYDKPENIQVKVVGKLENNSVYEKVKNVTLKNDALELVEFDLRDQTPGNYFIKVVNQASVQSTRLNLNTKEFSVFVQTDKAIYKPGDKVQFRVLVLNSETKPFMTSSVKIFVTDSGFNRIKQYDKIFFRKGVFRQELQLSDEPVLGIWQIHVRINNQEVDTIKDFEVDQYVLPKFEVTVKTKEKITKNDDIVVAFDAKYTYGKDVDGTATVSAQLNDYWWGAEPPSVIQHLDNGTKTATFNLKKDLNLEEIYWTRTVQVTVSFTEALTGKQRNGTGFVQIYDIPYTIEMTGSDDSIKPGLPFTVKAFVKDIVNEAPVTDAKEAIELNVVYSYDTYDTSETSTNNPFEIIWWRPPITKTVSFKLFLKNGIAELPITATPNVTSINIDSLYKNARGYFWISILPTESNQYLEIKTSSDDNFSISKPAKIEVVSNVKINSINYIVFARNKIVTFGKLKAQKTKIFSFQIQPKLDMIPTAKIIAFYVTQNGEIISDRKILNFNAELNNFVNIQLSKTESRPNLLVNISVKSMPMSYVGLLGVDQSVLLLKSGNDIDKRVVSDDLAYYLFPDKYNSDWQEFETYNYYTDFSALEAVILTNANEEYHRPYPFPIFPIGPDSDRISSGSMPPPTSSPFEMSSQASSTSIISQEKIPSSAEIVTRKEFPETWLFDCIDNIKGNTTITRKIPDSITSWIITGFSIDFQHGLGLTQAPTKLRVFMPFFISLNLPYSIKRGEIIAIQANIFNYMDQDHPAVVTMYNEKQEFEFVENNDNQKQVVKSIMTASNSGTSVKFLIKALKVGYITLKIQAEASTAGDRVEQQLLVEAEGITRYVNEAVLIDLRNRSDFFKSVAISVPQNFVPDSLKIEASFIGDILGPTIDNLDKLLQMPYGCGEQNMLNFVPDIIILDYLTNVNKLTPEIEVKAKSYMESGYQRQLNYKRSDGSYSAFGSSDIAGSTWLSAFVARSFNQASKYMTIDFNSIAQALGFLQSVQADDGSFPEYGVVHHKPMQGGSSSGTTLTAYVLLTFLENKELSVLYKKVVDKAVDNLIEHVKDINDVYAMSIIAYTLYLANKTSEATLLVDRLDKMANNSLGMRHFDKKSDDYYMPSLSIEASSYVLLAYLEASRETDALLIANWLVSQRNAFGGFSSTQDTVVGLFALSRMASRITTKAVDMKISLSYKNAVKLVNISQSNALILQKVEIPSSVQNINVSATGSGFALAQISYHYNINDLKKTSNFLLKATIDASTVYEFTLNVCAQLKNLNQSNMAVIEISSPSGYIFDIDDQTAILELSSTIKKVDYKNGNTLVQIYFDYLEANPKCIFISATRAFDVAEQKPASVIVYDYYENDLRSEVFYTPSKILLCDICDAAVCANSCK